MNPQTIDAAPKPQHLNPDDAAQHLTSRLQAAGIDRTISGRLLEAWRSLRKGPRFTRALGRVWYQTGELDAFVQTVLRSDSPRSLAPESLLPTPFLARELSATEASHAWHLLHGGRGVRAAFEPDAPHVAPFRAACRRATTALRALVEKAADDGLIALALDRAVDEWGSVDKVEHAALVRALDQLTDDFKEQLARWAASQVGVAAACELQRQHRMPLRAAVSTRLEQLVQERHAAVRKRDALGYGKAVAQPNELIAAGIPADKLDAVRVAIGEPTDVPGAIGELQARVCSLNVRIDRLKDFPRSELGDYRLLDGEGFDDLIAAERVALGLDVSAVKNS